MLHEPVFWRFTQSSALPIKTIDLKQSRVFDNSFFLYQDKSTRVVVKIPKNNFRPSASDAFHMDVWNKGVNILRDSGSYSYNAGDESMLFKSVESHNTIKFGESQQMPKISRFLFGKWLNTEELVHLSDKNSCVFTSTYTDYNSNQHKRSVKINTKSKLITVVDTVKTSTETIVTQFWNFGRDVDVKSGNQICIGDSASISFDSKANALLESGSTSLYYLDKLESRRIRLLKQGSIQFTTVIKLK